MEWEGAQAFSALKTAGGWSGRNYISYQKAMAVPAVWCAVTFMSRILAMIPLKNYRILKSGHREHIHDEVDHLLNGAVTDEMTSFDFKAGLISQSMSFERSVTRIQRHGNGTPENLWLLPAETTMKRRGTDNRSIYRYNKGDPFSTDDDVDEYEARDVIDVPFMLQADTITGFSPLQLFQRSIILADQIQTYAQNHFSQGGTPIGVMTGPMGSPEAVARMSNQVRTALQRAAANTGLIIPLPDGYDLKPLGIDPEKSQMLDTRQFQTEESCRIFQIPPVFMHYLENATYSNVEQQGKQLGSFYVGTWTEQIKQEVNLKIHGRANETRTVDWDVDVLQRGDFQSRVAGLCRLIQNGARTINEVRALDHYPPVDGGDEIRIQQNMAPADEIGDGDGDGNNPDGNNQDDSGA